MKVASVCQDEPTIIAVKKGMTISWTCTYKFNGVPTSLAGAVLTGQVRDRFNNLLATATVTADPDQVTNPGKFTYVVAAADTANFPLVETKNRCLDTYLLADMVITTGAVKVASETFYLDVQYAVTQ